MTITWTLKTIIKMEMTIHRDIGIGNLNNSKRRKKFFHTNMSSPQCERSFSAIWSHAFLDSKNSNKKSQRKHKYNSVI